jgi:hypothetical protein
MEKDLDFGRLRRIRRYNKSKVFGPDLKLFFYFFNAHKELTKMLIVM